MLYNRFAGVPRSVIPLYAILLLMLLCAPRFLFRLRQDRRILTGTGQRALIVGAGKAGEMLARDLLRERGAAYVPVALVDDDPAKAGWEVHNIRVYGDCGRIPRLVSKLQIDVLLIAVPSANPKQMRRIVEICEATELPVLTLPSVTDILSGQVTKETLRDVSIEDLLGRSPVKLDWNAMRSHMQGKRVLVSGGGGSIGSELCQQLAQLPIAELVVFEKCEYNLYRIEMELSRLHPELAIHAILGDVADAAAVEHALVRHKPDLIFHAAAYKHVPLLETQVREAAHNNVLGTRRLAEAALAHGVDEFVLISTDKAVRPSNIMGASKRAAELLCQSLNGLGATRFITVRFGNVLGSAGSVVPLFREQIQAGGPITVTHPDVTRYFMTIPEACQLIMQAAAVGQGGEVFVLDMGDPIKIAYLAEQMIRLSGKRPGTDIGIRYVGLRPGEKLYEELFLDEERPMPTPHAKLLLARSGHHWDWQELSAMLNRLAEACNRFDDAQTLTLLKTLVPEYHNAADPIPSH
ncbi:polysaccharide biosynthesis protein [Methylogaea oryzae]|nr:nucleoside-diphosphate sugar epimerase/dehydratase [Methylogaea oryzae]